MMPIAPVKIPRRYRRRVMAAHGDLRAESKRFWAWPWGRGLQPTCGCGWRGDLVRPMPIEFPMDAEELAFLQMDGHVRDELEKLKRAR